MRQKNNNSSAGASSLLCCGLGGERGIRALVDPNTKLQPVFVVVVVDAKRGIPAHAKDKRYTSACVIANVIAFIVVAVVVVVVVEVEYYCLLGVFRRC